MLDILRQNAKNVLTYVLFGIIILVFIISFGPGSRGCTDVRVTQASWAAKVNGESLSGSQFEEQYADLFRSYQARAGQGFTRELADQIGLRKVAMDQLVERELLLQAGTRAGVVITDEDLERAIKGSLAFHVAGRFDRDQYQRAVSARYGNAARFEERMRRDLMLQKSLALLRGAVQVSEDEVREAYQAESDQVALEFVRFPTASLKGEVVASAAQVGAMEKEKERIAAFYKENASRFDRKKRVRARHVLVRSDEKAPPEQDGAARKKVEDVLARAARGEDFGKIASQISEDPGSKEKGGDLGWFGTGMMARPFEEAAFAAAKGALAGPVRTRFGWHAIQVTDVAEPEVVSLEKATPEIARELAEADLARTLAGKRAAEALAQARKGRSFAELFPPEPGPDSKDGKKGPPPVKWGSMVLRPDDTGSFGIAARPGVPRLGPQPQLFDDALAASGPQLLSRVYDTPAGPVIARVKTRTRPDLAQLASRRGEVEQRLRQRREGQLEQAFVKGLRDGARVEVNEAWVRGDVVLPPVQLDQ